MAVEQEAHWFCPDNLLFDNCHIGSYAHFYYQNSAHPHIRYGNFTHQSHYYLLLYGRWLRYYDYFFLDLHAS